MQLNIVSPRHRSAALVPLCLTVLVIAAVVFSGNFPTHAATPAGTLIDNQATLEYDGGYVTSNVVSITIAHVAGVSITPSAASSSGASAETAFFPVTVTNEGNGADSFSLSTASQSGWPCSMYRDDNSDGIRQETEQTVISSTGSLGMGQSFRFLAVVSIPANAPSGSTDAITISARSTYDSTIASSVNYSVQVEQAVGLALDPTQALMTAAPGSKAYIAFSITNIGNDEDTASLSVSCDLGWPAAIIADANKDGVHQDSETTAINSIDALAAGEQGHAFVEVQVPANLAEDTQANVLLTATSALDSTKTVQGSYGVLGKVPPPGDVDGDGSITSLDIEAIAQMAVGAGSWTTEQCDRADVNGDGTINLLDLSGLLSASSQQQTQPVPATGRQLVLPVAKAFAGFLGNLGINIDDGAQVAGIQATVLFDSSLLSVLEVSTGSLMETNPDWEIVYVVDGNEVRLLAYNASGESLTSGTGAVLDISTLVSESAQPGDESPLIWADALLCTASGEEILPLETVEGLLTVETPGALNVQVCRDSDTTPIAGAQVDAWLDGRLMASGLSDDYGNCDLSPLPSGYYDIHVSAFGFYGETMPEVLVTGGETATTGLDLVALPQADTGAIEGIVLDEWGKPLSQSNVTIYRNGKRIASLYTDGSGCYQKLALSPGNYTVTVRSRGFAKASATVTVLANDMAYADFLLAANRKKRR